MLTQFLIYVYKLALVIQPHFIMEILKHVNAKVLVKMQLSTQPILSKTNACLSVVWEALDLIILEIQFASLFVHKVLQILQQEFV